MDFSASTSLLFRHCRGFCKYFSKLGSTTQNKCSRLTACESRNLQGHNLQGVGGLILAGLLILLVVLSFSKFSRFQDFELSRFQYFKIFKLFLRLLFMVSKFSQTFMVSRFQDFQAFSQTFMVSKFSHTSMVSRFQDFQDFKMSRFSRFSNFIRLTPQSVTDFINVL